MLADTSSAPAGSTADVGKAAVALAALIVEPILAKSEAAADRYSVAAVTNDIPHLQTWHRRGNRLLQVHRWKVARGNTMLVDTRDHPRRPNDFSGFSSWSSG